ncbi:differentially expressed in FDCP 8 homolog isoform X2 [Centruroides vittatus]|uniref:differentially expressed in FDCP 8 homolog isoform X2 n=1 Tax=Centruroides vittatus TaxID=120091 RepID=UPI00350F4221
MYKETLEKKPINLQINEIPSDITNLKSDACLITPSENNLNFDSSCPDELNKRIDEELGLSEDHFSRPEGYFGFSNVEELEIIIETCEKMIKESTENSEWRKNLVMKLVQLRLKLEDYKDKPNEEISNDKVVLGHQFEVKQLERPQQYCEKCCQPILCPLYSWYCCKECGFKCHTKCLNTIIRVCAKTKVLEKPVYILDICPEVGLSAQNYRCAECRRKIITKEGSMLPRKCDYNGLFYCSYCHWNSRIVIPARVIHNWDFEPRKVCRASLQFLKLMVTKPVLNVEALNSMLFPFVTELCMVKKLREEILMMKQYFLTCHAAQESRLLLILQDRQHFVESPDMYSMQDLIDIKSGYLLKYLHKIQDRFIQHITKECQGCRGKGFICELCKSDNIVFPFESHSTSCPKCSAVFHKECFYKRMGHCPRCARRTKAAEKSLT